MKKLVGYVLERNEESIRELEKKIENGGNKKSIESTICGIKKNNEILKLVNDLLDGKNGDAEVIKNDLIDKVVIKKVNGVNKYFVEV